MKIVNGLPPNHAAIVKAFGEPAPTVVYTYGDTLYIPSGKKPDKQLLAHEETHTRQQSITSPEDWWEHYLADPQFRLEQELEAYRVQYKAMFTLPRKHRLFYLEHIAKSLSGEMYGKIVTFDEAVNLITEGKADRSQAHHTTNKPLRVARKKERQNRKKARR